MINMESEYIQVFILSIMQVINKTNNGVHTVHKAYNMYVNLAHRRGKTIPLMPFDRFQDMWVEMYENCRKEVLG